MTIRELVQRVQSLYSKGVQSDDSRLSSRHIYNKLSTVRAKLISEQAKKKQVISSWNYQTIPCVKLIQSPLSECPCLPPVGCDILKSEYPIPKPLYTMDSSLIKSVTSLDGQTVYSETAWEKKKYTKGLKYGKTVHDYYIRNGYLYVTQRLGTKVLTVTGLFENPLEAAQYKGYCNPEAAGLDPCKSLLDYEFPIDNGLIEPMIELSLQELIAVFGQATEDLTNDGKDNVVEQSK